MFCYFDYIRQLFFWGRDVSKKDMLKPFIDNLVINNPTSLLIFIAKLFWNLISQSQV